MPRRNIGQRCQRGKYHVYNRGRAGRAIFRDDRDRDEFLALVSRTSRQLGPSIEIHAYCLMTTHFHLVVNQRRDNQLSRFMACLLTAYSKYFNERYGTSGPLCEGPFRARRLNTVRDYRWAFGYVIDNHKSGVDYKYSSHRALLDPDQRPGWLSAEKALKQFGGEMAYKAFLSDRDLRKKLQAGFFDHS